MIPFAVASLEHVQNRWYFAIYTDTKDAQSSRMFAYIAYSFSDNIADKYGEYGHRQPGM